MWRSISAARWATAWTIIVFLSGAVTAQEPEAQEGAAAVEGVFSAEGRIRRALEEKTSLTFEQTPLREVVEQLRARTKSNVLIDRKALDEVGLADDHPITGDLREISLRSMLNLVLRDADLAWIVRDGALVITTPEEAEAKLTTTVYNVKDLAKVPGAAPRNTISIR